MRDLEQCAEHGRLKFIVVGAFFCSKECFLKAAGTSVVQHNLI